MARCDWCNKKADKLFDVENMGNSYKICKDCKDTFDSGVCKVCGSPLGMYSVKGVCIACEQIRHAEKQKAAEELSYGVDPEVQSMYTSPSEFTEEDFEKWMLMSQGKSIVTPEERRRFRKNWVIGKLAKSKYWTPELIDKNLNDIEAIMDRNFSVICSNKCTLIPVKPKMGFVEILDREHKVILVDNKNL